jgi:DNA-binding IclR family transcriptional regulator
MKEIQSLERGINILFQFSKEHPFMTTEEIAQAVNLPKSSVYRFLFTLRKCGLLERNSLTGQYSLGLRLLELEEVVHSTIDLETISKPFLVTLGEFSGETVQLNILHGEYGICLYGIESPSAFRLAPEKGRIIPLYAGASGQSILAFADQALQDKICENPLERFTPHTIIDPQKLKARLAEIRKQGYVITRQEVYIGSLGIAAPVFGRDGQVMGSVSLSGPIQRISEKRKSEIKDELVRTAKEITDRMMMLKR